MREVPCPDCGGARLKPLSLAVTVDGHNIAEVVRPVDRRGGQGAGRRSSCPSATGMIAERVRQGDQRPHGLPARRRPRLPDARPRRPARSPAARPSASGWRPRSARGLVGVLYVLDEPSIGLHQRDNRRLIETLIRLRDLGNTVLVVEHDEETIRVADHVVDIGPGAGEHGGEIVHAGHGQGAAARTSESITGQYLSGKRSIPVPEHAPASRATSGSSVRGAREHNLKNIDVEFPLGLLRRASPACRARASRRWSTTSCYRSLMQKIYRSKTPPGLHKRGRRHRARSTRSSTSTSRRSAARPARTRPPTPACSTTSASCSPRPRRPRSAATCPGRFSLQRQGRPLRGVRRRRHDQDRDALPARRVRAVRGVQGRPLQPRHARHHVQGQEHRRGARHAAARRRSSSSPTSRPSPATCRRWSTSASATCGSGQPAPDAVGRRGAAGEAGARAGQALDRPHDLHPRRAHHRPALRGHPQAAHRAVAAWSTRATPCWSSSTTST